MSGSNHHVIGNKAVYSQDLESLGIEYLSDALEKNKGLNLENTKSMVLLNVRELLALNGDYKVDVAADLKLLIDENKICCTTAWRLDISCRTKHVMPIPVVDIISDGEVVIIVFAEPSIIYNALFVLIDVCGLTHAEVSKGMLHSWT